jgi:hypothetical protein
MLIYASVHGAMEHVYVVMMTRASEETSDPYGERPPRILRRDLVASKFTQAPNRGMDRSPDGLGGRPVDE